MLFSLHANILIIVGKEDLCMEIYVSLYVIYSVCPVRGRKAFYT